MASQLSQMSIPHEAATTMEGAVHDGEGASPPPQPHHGGERGTSTDSAQSNQSSVATTASRNGDNVRPSVSREKSCPSLDTNRWRRRQEVTLHDDDDGTPVTVTRSKSFVDSNNNIQNRRREISGLMVRQQSFQSSSPSLASMSSGDSKRECCQLHPQVRLRSGRCPRRAAGEKTKISHSFGKGSESYTAAASGENANFDGDNTNDIGVRENDKIMVEEEEEVPLLFCEEAKVEDGHNLEISDEIHKAADTTTNTSHENEIDKDAEEEISDDCVDDEIEEVSLDERWANALLFISQRLADQKSQGNNSEACATKPSSIPILDHELQQTIERATQSVRRFSVGSTGNDGEEEDEYCETEEEDEYDDISESSIARDCGTPTKMFAESKGGQNPPQVDRHPIANALLDHFAPGNRFVGTDVMASNISSCPSSGSDSSVTLSEGSFSDHTAASCNSLSAPPPLSSKTTTTTSPDLGPTSSNDTYDSPTCVTHKKAYDEDYSHRHTTSYRERPEEEDLEVVSLEGEHLDVDSPQEEEEEEEENNRVDISFDESTTTLDVQEDDVIVEDVTSDESDDDEGIPPASYTRGAAVTSSSVSPRKPPPTIKSPGPSFFSALVHNSRSRSKSCPRAKSKSRVRNAAAEGVNDRAESRPRRGKSKTKNAKKTSKKLDRTAENHDEKENVWRKKREEEQDQSTTETNPHGTQPSQRNIQPDVVAKHIPDEYPQHKATPPVLEPMPVQPCPDSSSLQQDRGPITHPNYKLGDLARSEDMLVFPKKSSSHNRRARARRRRRRRRKRDNNGSHEGDGSSCNDSDDDDAENSRKGNGVDIDLAIGQLRHLDAAFVRRSDGQWTYALVADGDPTQIRFVVNNQGSTKSFPQLLWKSCVRRIRVLTPRQGDRFAISKPARKKRSIGGSRSRGKGRMVSPSPTRRNSSALILPPTIMEGKDDN